MNNFVDFWDHFWNGYFRLELDDSRKGQQTRTSNFQCLLVIKYFFRIQRSLNSRQKVWVHKISAKIIKLFSDWNLLIALRTKLFEFEFHYFQRESLLRKKAVKRRGKFIRNGIFIPQASHENFSLQTYFSTVEVIPEFVKNVSILFVRLRFLNFKYPYKQNWTFPAAANIFI